MGKTIITLSVYFGLILTILGQSVQDSLKTVEINPVDSLMGINLSTDVYDRNTIQLESIHTEGQINLLNILKSQFSGLSVMSTSGAPGASTSAVIRGSRSVLNSNGPLIILDGIPISNMEWGASNAGVDLSNRLIDLNIRDIESIQILKSIASTVKYGIRGGNGAIVLKTKTNRQSKPKVNIYTSIFTEQVNQLPKLQSQYAQGRSIDGFTQYLGPETTNGFSWGPEISNLEWKLTNKIKHESGLFSFNKYLRI